MFLSPKIWGSKYTNYFLFINKKPEFQCFGLLITLSSPCFRPVPAPSDRPPDRRRRRIISKTLRFLLIV